MPTCVFACFDVGERERERFGDLKMAGVSGGNMWSGESRGWSSLFLHSGAADSQCVSAEMGNFSWGLDVSAGNSVDNAASSAATNDLFANLGGEQLGDSPTLMDSAVFVDSQAWNQTLMRNRGGDSVQNMQGSLGNLNEGFFNRQKELVVGEVPSEWEMRNFGGEDTMKNFTGEDTTFSTTTTENGFSHFSTSAALSDLGSPILQTTDQTVTHSIPCANRFNNRSLQLPVPQFDMSRIKQECSVLDQSGTTLLSQGLESDACRKQDISGILESSANRPFLKAMAYDNGQAFMQGEDQYPGLWPSTNSFPISLSQILPTSSQPIGPLNTNRNSPLWDLIFSKSDIKPHHAIQNFQHFGLEKKVQMNRITQNLARSHQHGDDGRECSSENAKRCNNESSTSDTIFKRPRLDTTNCTMPTFKVRKEKMSDRITALQQLVSPFGKTDTASVLLEAIGYIKFLHDQVQVLSTPYMNNGAANSGQGGETGWAGGSCEGDDSDGGKQDLRSRGLCLVPVSATLSVTNDNGADYWSPALGCNYR